MITIFACPKAFRGHFGIIQENAARSWAHLDDDVQVILIGDDEGVAEVAAELGVEHVPEVARNDRGTPLVSDIFAAARRRARHDLLCYVNADIILLDCFAEALRRLRAHPRPFLAVGRRWDLDVTEPLELSPGWQQRIREDSRRLGSLHGEQGLDYFCFPRDALGGLPSFSVGRPAWDTWMLFRARQRGLDLIDMTPAVVVVHQNHDYSHVGQTREQLWSGPEREDNIRLAGGSTRLFTLQHATHVLGPRGVERPLDAWHLLGRAAAAPFLHRSLRPLRLPVRAVRRLLYETEPLRRRRGWVIDDPRA